MCTVHMMGTHDSPHLSVVPNFFGQGRPSNYRICTVAGASACINHVHEVNQLFLAHSLLVDHFRKLLHEINI